MKKFIIHPFLFAMFPVLFLFAKNTNIVYFSETLGISSVVILAAACLFLVL